MDTLLRADQTGPLERSNPEGPSCETIKMTEIKLLLTLCLLQSIIIISFPTQSPERVKMYVIKRQFGLFLQHFLLMYDKPAALISLCLLTIVIFHEIIWLFYSDVILFF